MVFPYTVQMFCYSGFQFTFGLTDILLSARCAGKHIYDIFCRTIAYMPFFVSPFGGGTGECVCPHKDVSERTVAVNTVVHFPDPVWVFVCSFWGGG